VFAKPLLRANSKTATSSGQWLAGWHTVQAMFHQWNNQAVFRPKALYCSIFGTMAG
jgi:hypothetical protein